MHSNSRPGMTEAEYIEFERESVERHEYLRGEVFAMSGGSIAHSLISMNVGGLLRSALHSRCRVFNGDMRVHSSVSGLYTYADAKVICGKIERHPKFDDVVINPSVIVEVLSPRTEHYDRGAKFVHYKSIPSLREYMLVSQSERCIEHWVRGDPRWGYARFTGADRVVVLPTLEIEIPFSEIYLGADDVPEPEEGPTPRPSFAR